MKCFLICGVVCSALTLGLGACSSDDGDNVRVGTILALQGVNADGKTHFDVTCGLAACHGSEGNNGLADDLTAVVSGKSDTELVNLFLNGEGKMPAVSGTDQQLADVLLYVTETF